MSNASPLGARMKAYEAATAAQLPRKTWSVLRLDGKSFHSYTKDLNKPFDALFMNDMTLTMKFLCEKIGGAVFGYTQSDEISIVMHDLGSEGHQPWFGGKVQKMVSVSASMAGAYFNHVRRDEPSNQFAFFDARVFPLPSVGEVKNYLLWRQWDAYRNSLFMAASEFYSHSELLRKGAAEKISLLREVGRDFDEYYTNREKYGSMARKVAQVQPVTYARKDTGEIHSTEAERSWWISTHAVPFAKHWDEPGFNFLRPEEGTCQPNEFSLLGLMPASTSG